MTESIHIEFNNPDADRAAVEVFLHQSGTYFKDRTEQDMWWLSTSTEETELINEERQAGDMPYVPFAVIHATGINIFTGGCNQYPTGLTALVSFLEERGYRQALDEDGDPLQGTLVQEIAV